MARVAERDASVAAAAPYRGARRRGLLSYIPGLAYVLGLYLAGTYFFPDPHSPLVEWRGYRITWIEFLLVTAAIVGLAEQLRVSHPGLDNTVEALVMAAIAGAMVLLFALAGAGVGSLAIFNSAPFLMLTLIALAQTVVAVLINARTLRRSIGLGDSE
jgi:hypothetical protein